MHKIRLFVENNVSITLMLFFALGMVIPGVEKISAWTNVYLLAVVIFLACYKINFNDLKRINHSSFALFYLIRFIVIPFILYYSLAALFPTSALALFLLALLPPATSSPAMSSLFKGNVSLSFSLLVIGSLLTPLLLPVMIYIVSKQSAAINIYNMLMTLAISIVLPIVVYAALRNQQKIRTWVRHDGTFISILLIGLTITIGIAKHKAMIVETPSSLTLPLAINTVGFFLFYICGWFIIKNAATKDKIAYALSSGANNIGLGVSIAILYFPPDISLFLIIGIFPWILAFIPFKRWVT